jgi:hypothetical protein
MSPDRKHAPARLRAALFTCALVACAFSSAAAQAADADDREQFESGYEDTYKTWHLPSGTSKEEAAALNARWKALGEELKSDDAGEFAGTYFSGGETRRSLLRWAPEGGFVFLYVYENFSVLDFSYGKVSVTPAGVVFNVERERKGLGGGSDQGRTPQRWVAARWRTANYLLPENEVAKFGQYVGGFDKYNDFNGPCCEFAPFLSSAARRDALKSFEEPAVPAPYARLIRRPIEAKIKSVGRRRVVKDYGLEGEFYEQGFQRASLTPVTIDAGRNRRVRRGLLFRIVGSPYGQYLKIVRVRPSSSEGVIIRSVDEDGLETFYDSEGVRGEPQKKVYPPVNVGAIVTTSPPDIRAHV